MMLAKPIPADLQGSMLLLRTAPPTFLPGTFMSTWDAESCLGADLLQAMSDTLLRWP